VSLRRRLGALEERPFRLLWLGQTTSSFGDGLVFVALAFAVFQVGGGAGALGIVLAAFTLARAGFILVGGVWADRLPRRFVMLAADLVRAGVQAYTAVALLTGTMETWMFVVAGAVLGAAQAFFGPASTGLIAETVSRERLQQANALIALSQSGTAIFGPAVAGLLIAATEPAWAFALDAVTFLVSAAFLARLRVLHAERPPRRRFLAELVEGCREAWSRGWLRAGFLLAGIANVGLGVFFVLGPVIAERELGGAAAWGMILTGGAIGGVAGSALGLRLRPGRPIVASFAAWSLAVLPPFALLPPLPALAVAVANGLFVGGIVYGNAVYEAVLQREIPPERLARVTSFDWMVSLVFMPLGQTLAGPLAEIVGTDAVLVGAAALIAVACAVGIATPSVRALRGEAPPTPPSADDELARASPAPEPSPEPPLRAP
jgi:MFS family permease